MLVRVNDYLEDYDLLADAHRAYIADLNELAANGDFFAQIASQVSLVLQEYVKDLEYGFTNSGPSRTMNTEWRPKAFVLVGTADRRFYTRKIGDATAIVVDLDLFLRLAILVFMIGLDEDDDVMSEALASFLLLSIVLPREEQFPCIEDLLKACARRNARVVNDLFTAIGKFILFHELGHSYVDDCGSDFLRIVFGFPPHVDTSTDAIKSVRYHRDGTIYNQIDFPGSENGLLVVTPTLKHWEVEFASDVFAAYAQVYTSAKGTPKPIDLDILVAGLTCWQLVLLALGSRQTYMRSVAGCDSDAVSTHPAAGPRVDVLFHHVNFLAEEFAPDWKSSTVTLFKEQYDSLWGRDLMELLNDAVEYARYTFDEEGPHIDQGRIRSFAHNTPVRYKPSTFAKLKKDFIGPFLVDEGKLGWSTAVQNKREEYREYVSTFRLNERPIIQDLGRRLHALGLRLISEDRQ